MRKLSNEKEAKPRVTVIVKDGMVREIYANDVAMDFGVVADVIDLDVQDNDEFDELNEEANVIREAHTAIW